MESSIKLDKDTSGSFKRRCKDQADEYRRKLLGVDVNNVSGASTTPGQENVPGPSNRPHPVDVSLQDTDDSVITEREESESECDVSDSESENGNYNLESASSSDNDSSSDDETVSVPQGPDQGEEAWREKLRIWATHSNISHRQLRGLLRILHEPHSSLPLDPRTLLGTPTEPATVFEMDGGTYWHNGLGKYYINVNNNSTG
uniref:Putative myelin protein regulatory factor-like a n=1 Tax=Anopheles darlingi TaxID=43151 RepID=A0A2M4CWX4_ANODA